MIRLADAGWTAPRRARRLGAHPQTVRTDGHAFLAEGVAALPDRPRPGRPPTVTAAPLTAVAALGDAGGRPWTTAQVVAWLARKHGVRLPPAPRSRRRHARRFGGKRTVASVAPTRRDPAGDGTKVVGRDTDSVHHRQAGTDHPLVLAASDGPLGVLPPSSPARNPIAPVWRQGTDRALPARRQPTDTALPPTTEAAQADRPSRLAHPTITVPRPAWRGFQDR